VRKPPECQGRFQYKLLYFCFGFLLKTFTSTGLSLI
jgi:hypothetical protein